MTNLLSTKKTESVRISWYDLSTFIADNAKEECKSPEFLKPFIKLEQLTSQKDKKEKMELIFEIICRANKFSYDKKIQNDESPSRQWEILATNNYLVSKPWNRLLERQRKDWLRGQVAEGVEIRDVDNEAAALVIDHGLDIVHVHSPHLQFYWSKASFQPMLQWTVKKI